MSAPVKYTAVHLDVAAQSCRECGGSSLLALIKLGHEVRVTLEHGSVRVRVYGGKGGWRSPIVEARERRVEPACLDAHAQIIALRQAERVTS